MSFTHYQDNFRLFARNEGKIKSYESCIDVRAWSHDVRKKDRHLREWMKADMPICILPSSTVATFLRTMTCRSRRRATPRCHPDCKTKILLESICNSCQTIRECLKQNDSIESFFVEEELETSHWPCDRCLEALKSIKMFWKIIIDKIFHLNLSKYEEFSTKCEPSDSVRSVAKSWESEITKQAYFLKNMRPVGNTSAILKNRNLSIEIPVDDKTTGICKPINVKDIIISDSKTHVIEPTDSNLIICRKTFSRGTSVRVNKMVDVACDTCFADFDGVYMRAFKKQIEHLQEKNYHQTEEMETLRKENLSLKIELDNIYKSCPWKSSVFKIDDKDNIAIQHTLDSIPKPFESNIEDNSSMKQIDSEMIITMKNCRNRSYKHVSLLQVLHKTNVPVIEDMPRCNSKHEDPIKILTKVQNTFGAIVKREMNIVNEKRHRPKKSDMDSVTAHRIHASRSVPSCSTVSSRFSSSEQDFVRFFFQYEIGLRLTTSHLMKSANAVQKILIHSCLQDTKYRSGNTDDSNGSHCRHPTMRLVIIKEIESKRLMRAMDSPTKNESRIAVHRWNWLGGFSH